MGKVRTGTDRPEWIGTAWRGEERMGKAGLEWKSQDGRGTVWLGGAGSFY